MKLATLLTLATFIGTGAALAQTTTHPPAGGVQTAPTAQTPPGGVQTVPMTQSPAGARTAATDKDSNAAVQSREGNDTNVPAKGSNSFTEGQAKGRIENRGYTNVAELKKDDEGVWRGQAQKSGASVHVWVDYKGNVGEQQ